MLIEEALEEFLNRKVEQFNQPAFIETDPIAVPHRFSKKADIEIAGFFAAIFAWGIRTTIINKTNELMRLMDDSPHQFVLHHTAADLKKLLGFVHRTFNTTDLLYTLAFLRHHYHQSNTLETAFTTHIQPGDTNTENALNGFYQHFFSLEDAPARTQKHIAAPFKKSACKRLNMYLRWMVRKDNCGVDFGIWKNIAMHQLVIPLDLHVARVARSFHLLQRPHTDWLAALELTNTLKQLNANDPCRYDYALFALGVLEKFR